MHNRIHYRSPRLEHSNHPSHSRTFLLLMSNYDKIVLDKTFITELAKELDRLFCMYTDDVVIQAGAEGIQITVRPPSGTSFVDLDNSITIARYRNGFLTSQTYERRQES